MRVMTGRPASPGVEAGPLFLFRRPGRTVERRRAQDPHREWQRFLQAQSEAIQQLRQLEAQALKNAGPEVAQLFEVHQLMAQDEDYMDAVRLGVEGEGLNAEAALYDAAQQTMQLFRNAGSDTIRQREMDVRDVSGRILSILTGQTEPSAQSGQPAVIVADDLAPSDLMALDREKVLGLVLLGGSAESHTAILARSLSIPMVVQVGQPDTPLPQGQEVWVDGGEGRLILEADAETCAALAARREHEHERRKLLLRLKGKPNVTLDGQQVDVVCNIGMAEECRDVLDNDGGGVGLLRSEFLYLDAQDWPSEEQQMFAYRQVLARMNPRPVVVRTLDIGADKTVPYYQPPHQPNPALGLRGVRLSLSEPQILRTQLRALYRASVYGKLRILLPMVASVWELQQVRQLCRQVMDELDDDGYPYDPAVELGVMIETPAAVLIGDRLAVEADFFSIGTNDLTQYLTACDRQSGQTGRFFDPHHTALLRAIRLTVQYAHSHEIPVCVCGELAADLEMTEFFLSIGVDCLSVTPPSVLPLREKIRQTDVGFVREKVLADLDSDTEPFG